MSYSIHFLLTVASETFQDKESDQFLVRHVPNIFRLLRHVVRQDQASTSTWSYFLTSFQWYARWITIDERSTRVFARLVNSYCSSHVRMFKTWACWENSDVKRSVMTSQSRLDMLCHDCERELFGYATQFHMPKQHVICSKNSNANCSLEVVRVGTWFTPEIKAYYLCYGLPSTSRILWTIMQLIRDQLIDTTIFLNTC
jgi:hypothetical protein